MQYLLSFFLLAFVSSMMAAPLTLDPSKRLKASIAPDAMNRIAVINDRILQVFGDSEAYDIQTDEASGQIFIKPTIDHGSKPLAITLITEQNVTQDLLLDPVAPEATTILLQGSGTPPARFPDDPGDDHREIRKDSSPPLPSSMGYQGEILTAMKRLVLGQGERMALSSESERKSPPGLTITLTDTQTLGSFYGRTFVVTNTTDESIVLTEDTMIQPGDAAISLAHDRLEPHASTQLYTVHR